MHSAEARRTAIVWLVAFLVALPLLGFGLRAKSAPDRLAGDAAVGAALSNSAVRTIVDGSAGTHTRVLPLDKHNARVTFYRGSRVVLEAAVNPKGQVIAYQAIGPDYVRAGARFIQSPLVLVALSLLFLVFMATLPLRSVRNLDLLVLTLATVTIWVLNEQLFELSIALAIPILGYLALRCLRVGFHAQADQAPAKTVFAAVVARTGWQQGSVLRWAFALAAVAAAMICIPAGATGDVGAASLAGATQLLHGHLPYGHITTDIVHGDTYPIFTYVLYVPAAIFLPVRDAFDNTDGALWISTISLLVTAIALFVAGRDTQDRELGLRNAVAWLIFPPVLITASSGSNDMTTAMFVALALASMAYAGRSTLALSLAAWAKIVPVLALPLWIARYRREGLTRAIAAPVVLTVVLLLLVVIYGGFDGIHQMLDGVRFQSSRGSVLSPWTVLDWPALHLIVQAATLGAAAAAAYAVWQEPTLSARRICALAAGIMLAVQLSANYWSYAYLPWVYPLLVAALLWPARQAQRPE
ncbi:MAG: glycosyltransferase 87 family protein [Solirubrobacterales bacterium]